VRSIVLDADTVSFLIEQRTNVASKFAAALAADSPVYLCPVVRYQILRGLYRREATTKLARFHGLAGVVLGDALHEGNWECAAQLWAESRRSGRPHEDADILIAAYALNRDAVLVTNNARHFEHLPVPTESWLEPPPPTPESP
jgi:tRNA(fMet)-specific endonuclease VapC